jgi:hypothetical protein
MNGSNFVQSLPISLQVGNLDWQIEGVVTRYGTPARIDSAGNTDATAFNIGTLNGNGVFRDHVSLADLVDIYKFNLPTNRTVNFVIDGLSAGVTIELFLDINNNGAIDNGEAVPLPLQDGANFKLGSQSLVAGNYFLRVLPGTTTATSYNLTLDAANFTLQNSVQFPSALDEISGLVKGAGDFWWVIEDSGNSPTLIAVNSAGQTIRQITVNGANNVDWEELTVGKNPFGAGRVLFIGDFGNNTAPPLTFPVTFPTVGTRNNQVIYMITEPDPLAATSVNILRTLPIQFPTGNYDIEAMVYDARSQQLVLITKDLNGVASGTGGVSRVFTRSLDPAQPLLTEVATFDLRNRPLTNTQVGPYGLDRLVTGAALSDDGRVLVVRTYKSVFRWVRAPEESWQSLFTRAPQVITLVDEPQGEAIALGGNNTDFYTISEQDPDLNRYSFT